MVIVMEHAASEEQMQKVIETLVDEGYDVHRSSGIDYTVLGAVGVPRKPIDPRLVEVLPGVRQVLRISEPYKLAGRTFKSEDTVVDLGGKSEGMLELDQVVDADGEMIASKSTKNVSKCSRAPAAIATA